jgi:glycosyltransferase involved in cell wall biosynthesis
MTGSTEPQVTSTNSEGPLGVSWRAEREATQQRALPSGQLVVSCPAPFGVGGLGRHLKEIADAADRRGQPAICLCGAALRDSTPTPTPTPSPSPLLRELRPRGRVNALGWLTRFSPAWRNLHRNVVFDGYAARGLPAGEHLIAFNGQALKQFEAAARAGYQTRSLVSANPHLRRLLRQHRQAHRQYPLEGTWATHLLRRNLKEYEQAERIYVASRYAWESFVAEGVREERLSLFPLTPDPRFTVREPPSHAHTFDVVFVGRLCVTKGVPLLVDAVRRLAHSDLRLVLVGGWSSRGMRRFLQEACAHDPRITIGPGDPLPHLSQARLFAHPAYEDGFAYAPAEALACGVPVLVSEDTGMKELIDPGVSGMILPTGDLRALTEAIDAAYRGELLVS